MSWSSIKLSRLPEVTLSVWGHTAVISGEKDIVIFGGFDFCQEKPTNTTYILHTAQSNGFTKPNVSGTLPPAIYGHSSTQVGRKMFVFGGNLTDNQQVNDMYQFNTSNYSWSKPRPMGEPPLPRYGHSASLIYDNYILIFGGNNGGSGKLSKPLNDIHIFNTERNSWTKPSSNSSGSELIFNNELISPRSNTTSNSNGNNISNSINSSRIRSATISSHNNSPINTSSVLTNTSSTPPTFQQLHSPNSTSGSSNGSSDILCEQLETSMINGFRSPLSLSQRLLRSGFRSSPPSPRYFHSCSVVGGKAFIFGGFNGSTLLNDLYILNIESMEWVQPIVKGDQPSPRAGHTSIAIGSRLFIFGGTVEGDPSSCNAHCDNDLYLFETESCHWTLLKTIGTLPSPRTGHICLPISSKILIIGGSDAILNNKLKLSNNYHSLETLKLDFTHHHINNSSGSSNTYSHHHSSSSTTSSSSSISNLIKPRSGSTNSGGNTPASFSTPLVSQNSSSIYYTNSNTSPSTPRSSNNIKNSPKPIFKDGADNLLNSLQQELSPMSLKSIKGVDSFSNISLTQSADRNQYQETRGEFSRHYSTQSILSNKVNNGGSNGSISGSNSGGSNNSISSNDGNGQPCSTALCFKKYNSLKDSYLDIRQKYQDEREKRKELEKELEQFRLVPQQQPQQQPQQPTTVTSLTQSQTLPPHSPSPLSTSIDQKLNNTMINSDSVLTSKQILEIYEDIFNLWSYYEKRVKWKEMIEREANQQLEMIKSKIDQFTSIVGLESQFNFNLNDHDSKSNYSENGDMNGCNDNLSETTSQNSELIDNYNSNNTNNTSNNSPRKNSTTTTAASVHHSRSVSNPIPNLSQIVKQRNGGNGNNGNDTLTVPQQLHSSHNNLLQLRDQAVAASAAFQQQSQSQSQPQPQPQLQNTSPPPIITTTSTPATTTTTTPSNKGDSQKSTQKIFKLLISKKNRASGHFKLSTSNESANSSEDNTPTFNQPNLINQDDDDSSSSENGLNIHHQSNNSNSYHNNNNNHHHYHQHSNSFGNYSTSNLSSSISSTSSSNLQTPEEFEAYERGKQKKRLGKALKQMINKDKLQQISDKEKEKQDREREKQEKVERDRAEKEREKQEKEREKQEKIEREKQDKAEKEKQERLEKERLEKEKLEKKHKKIKSLFGAKSSNKEALPLRRDIIEKVINHLREHSLDTEGIFRLSGNMDTVRGIVKSFTHSAEPNLSFEIHNISNALKHYLRSLDPPLIPYEFFLMLLDARKNEDAETIRNIFWKIPSDNRVVLTLLVDLMVKISENSLVNKMNSKNLSIVFGPTILKPRTPTLDRMALMTETQLQCGIIQTFIEDFHYIFSEFPTDGPKSFLGGDDDESISSFGSNNSPSPPQSCSPTLPTFNGSSNENNSNSSTTNNSPKSIPNNIIIPSTTNEIENCTVGQEVVNDENDIINNNYNNNNNDHNNVIN